MTDREPTLSLTRQAELLGISRGGLYYEPAYLTFVIVSAVQTATPGPSTLFIVNNAVAHGWRRAFGTLSGDLLAIALLATLSIIGLGTLLQTYPTAFLILRLAGAFYIIWVGWTFLRIPPPQPEIS
ncbi:MAG: LysE family translocator [Roseovarius sp.]